MADNLLDDGRVGETLAALADGRVLLVSRGREGRPNAMAIGWGTVGVIWQIPVFTVLVRPSRFTWRLIEETHEFVVAVAGPTLKDAVTYCGTVSGRDHDKFEEKGLTAIPSKQVRVPRVRECGIHFECRVVHTNDVIPAQLDGGIRSQCYPRGDFHRLYFGRILACERS